MAKKVNKELIKKLKEVIENKKSSPKEDFEKIKEIMKDEMAR